MQFTYEYINFFIYMKIHNNNNNAKYVGYYEVYIIIYLNNSEISHNNSKINICWPYFGCICPRRKFVSLNELFTILSI